MQVGTKQILVIGDRLLVQPDSGDDRTRVGLYLPATVVDREPVQSGRVLEVGPGIAVPNFQSGGEEPWQNRREPPVRYMPVQAEIGDLVLFQRKEAVELRYQDKTFLVVPQGAVLLIIRDSEEPATLP
jgi:co-chaperonin GroES (HSP10)